MINHARSSAFLKAEQIHEHAARLKLLPFPSSNPALFATFICNLCQKLRDRIASSGAGEKETTLISLFLVDRVAPTLRFIEGASSENTPASLVVPVEKIGEEVLRGCRFMVRRQSRYNYSERELRGELQEALEGLLPETERNVLFKDLPSKLFAISFPSFERDNALLHVNFAHEIAHPLEQDYLDGQNQAAILQELKAEIENVTEENDPFRKRMEVTRRVTDAARKRQAALMEILSDTISAIVFGPSALFALYEVAILSTSMDRISADFHPPWRFRLREIFRILEEREFVDPTTFKLRGWPEGIPDCISGVKTEVDNWLVKLHGKVEDHSDMREIEKDPINKVAYDSAGRALPGIREFAAKSVPEHYTPSVFSEEVPELLKRLHSNLPPNRIEYSLEKNQQVRLASILSSGWLFKLGELEPVFSIDRDIYIQQVRTLNRLVLKAIQLSEIQEEYARKANKQHDGIAKQV
jgi:hypothetical protein